MTLLLCLLTPLSVNEAQKVLTLALYFGSLFLQIIFCYIYLLCVCMVCVRAHKHVHPCQEMRG